MGYRRLMKEISEPKTFRHSNYTDRLTVALLMYEIDDNIAFTIVRPKNEVESMQ